MNGFLHSIEWGNPYTAPPGGAPRVLAEIFTLTSRIPESLPTPTPGGGYSHYVTHISPPARRLTQEQLAVTRRQRLQRRAESRFPLLADQIVEEQLHKKAAYYEGITDAEIEEKRAEVLDAEAERYNRLVHNIGVLFIYASEPEECRMRAMAHRERHKRSAAG